MSDPNNIFSKKIIEKYPVKPEPDSINSISETERAKFKIAKRLVKEVKNGMNVNLGVGIPLMLPLILPPEIKINVHC